MIENTSNNTKTREIDIIGIIRTIWFEKKVIYKSVIILVFIGFVKVIFTPKEYTSEIKLLVETESASTGISGLLQQFGGLAGINLGSSKPDESISTLIYPDIVYSTPFLQEILNEKVHCSKCDSSITFSEFLLTKTRPSLVGFVIKYTIGLPGLIFNKTDNGNIEKSDNKTSNGLIKLTAKELSQIKTLVSIIKLQSDEETGILTIEVNTQDAVVSAELTNSVYLLLTKYILNYKIQKAKTDLDFVEARYNEAETRFNKAQAQLANFKDNNTNIILSSAKITEQNLQSEYNLSFNLLNTLAQKVEQSKLKVQEKTPVFKIIDPAKIPILKSKPKLMITTIYMVVLGFVIGIGSIVWKSFLKSTFFKGK